LGFGFFWDFWDFWDFWGIHFGIPIWGGGYGGFGVPGFGVLGFWDFGVLGFWWLRGSGLSLFLNRSISGLIVFIFPN
jgi:hypothetical protein